MPGSPSTVPGPCCQGRNTGSNLCGVGHLPGGLGDSQGGRGCAELSWPSTESSSGPGLPGTAHASTAVLSTETFPALCHTEKGLKPAQSPTHSLESEAQAEPPGCAQGGLGRYSLLGDWAFIYLWKEVSDCLCIIYVFVY